jgi:hypothetical protein
VKVLSASCFCEPITGIIIIANTHPKFEKFQRVAVAAAAAMSGTSVSAVKALEA